MDKYDKPFEEEKYRKKIKIIQTFIKKCSKIYHNLPEIKYNKYNLNYHDINLFYNISNRSNNDSDNKKRENVIGAILSSCFF